MDFFQIAVKEKKGGGLEAYPDFVVGRSKDLMVRAKNFYAIWDEEKGLWSTDEYDVQRIVDDKLHSYQKENRDVVSVRSMRSFDSNRQSTFRKYLSQIGDNSHQLDETLTFLSTKVTKEDYVSKRLPYDLAPGNISAWNELVGTLYNEEEREKIEWFLGSIVCGDSRFNQKFMVFYGPPGGGKGTILNIAFMLFGSYVKTFDAKALGSSGNQFASAAFADNPLVAIQHDGDLSRIEDNTTINSIVSHEVMKVNEKYKPAYDTRFNAALMMGTNKPVKITDAQSGLIRRLIDVHPSGKTLPRNKYDQAMARVEKQLGAIAEHCQQVYKSLGKTHYSNYRPVAMMHQTDVFFNFIETYFDVFEKQNGTSVEQSWAMYKEYCEEANIDKTRSLQRHRFKAELSNYFETFHERIVLDGVTVRSYYEGFKAQPYKTPVDDDVKTFELIMDDTTSLLNLELAEMPAQYAKADGTPSKYWDDGERLIGGVLKRPRESQVVDTYLQDLDPTQTHYVKVPDGHIVIDFDLRDADGNKSLELNRIAAAEWPPTYAEVSASGQGIHLHYDYTGDTEQLDPLYAEGIEIKVYAGNSALRRRLSHCNNVPVASISSGLPLKEKKRVLDVGTLKSEKALRDLIARNLRKEIHPGTKPSIDFIKKILDDAYEDKLQYDVSDMKQGITYFANESTNKALECLKIVQTMKFKGKQDDVDEEFNKIASANEDQRLVFFDIECYPNLFMICWKFEEDEPKAENVTVMINPKPHEVQALFGLRLVGFNVRKYDNHMLWAAAMGFSNLQLYNLSQKIISGAVGAMFGEAYGLSYTDIYDYSTKKQGLKKWQIELGLEHREMDIPWDQPVPEERIKDVTDYCINDVVSEELVHKHLDGDYTARLILADLAEMKPNDTTAKLTAGIVFGKDKNPQRSFVYTDLSKEFPGYVFEGGKSTYRGIDVGEGGLVRAKPGLYKDVGLLDVASMHPTSIGQLNLFGEYTPRYMAIVGAQLAIKNRRYDDAKTMLDGKLRPYIEKIEKLAATNPAAAEKARADLRYGLKIAMNIVYGLTSAKFDNPFRDIRNVDNIVAKRGALFMIDLMYYIEELGYEVVHVKTDSVKVPGVTAELIEKVQRFAEKYGYAMEHEATYEKLGLVNDAVYVAKKDQCVSGEWVAVEGSNEKTYERFLDGNGLPVQCWSATGSQYQHPYVFKRLFGFDDDVHFNDFCETKHVQQGTLQLDFGVHYNDDGLGYVEKALFDGKVAQKAFKLAEKAGNPDEISEAAKALAGAYDGYDEAVKKLVFVGKTGRFTPVKEGYGGGFLYRIKEGKHYAVQGTKNHLWVDSNIAMDLPAEAIDYDFFEALVQDAEANLEKFIPDSPFTSLQEFLA